jgi:hypothetical protein
MFVGCPEKVPSFMCVFKVSFLIVGSIYSETIPLYGSLSGLGYYFVDVMVGSPPQRQSAIVDTGSEGFSITCAPCSACGRNHMDPYFEPTASSSFTRLDQCPAANLRNPECVFEKRYLEGSSLKGKNFKEHVGFNITGVPSKIIPFGCIESETNLFKDQRANGIFGLAALPKTYWLKENPAITGFSICLAKEGGDLEFLTETESASKQGVSLSYTDGHFVISPSSVSVGPEWKSSDTQEFFGSQVLIDSGSTITYLKKELYDIVIGIIKSQIGDLFRIHQNGPSLCFDTDDEKNIQSKLPGILFEIPSSVQEKVFFNVPFSDYTYIVDGNVCLAIASNEDLDRTDLGASWMIGKQITFSTNNGWAEIVPHHACSSRSLSERRPGLAPPQRSSVMGASYLLGVIAVVLAIAACLVYIVKSNLRTSHYQAVTPDSE